MDIVTWNLLMSRGFPAFFRQFWLHFRKNFKKNLQTHTHTHTHRNELVFDPHRSHVDSKVTFDL